MPVVNQEPALFREQDLFFNKERILRLLRWVRRNKDTQPELKEIEQQRCSSNYYLA